MGLASYERLSQDDQDNLNDTRNELDTPQKHSRPSSLYDSAAFARPPTYYGEGPFDPPSSDSDEDEALLDKTTPSTPGLAERGNYRSSGISSKERFASLRVLITFLASLVVLAILIGIIAAQSYTGKTYLTPHGAKRITMDHVFNGTFFPQSQTVHWVPEAGDGVFSLFQDDYIYLVDLKTNTTTVLVNRNDIKNQNGDPLGWTTWKLSPDMKFLLLQADHLKQWRHSSHGNYYIHNIEAKTTYPITEPSNPPITSYATWSPTGQSIAFVASNDLYILVSPEPNTDPIRVTTSGNASLFHGVPDWVYEEEVFASDSALWWSPDSTKLAFLTLDETLVNEFKFPIYNPTGDAFSVVPYTSEVVMKYPKPGYPNPLVAVWVFDLERYTGDVQGSVVKGEEVGEMGEVLMELEWDGRMRGNDSVIMEVAWVGNQSLVVKEVNRNADAGSVVVFDLNASQEGGGRVKPVEERKKGVVVRKLGKDGEEGDDGWIDSAQNIHPLPPSLIPADVPGGAAYLDIVPTPEGYNHIALFIPVESNTPMFLTSGEWEVTSGVKGIDVANGLVYFEAAHPSSTERNVFHVALPSAERMKEAIAAAAAATTTTTTTTTVVEAWKPEFEPVLLTGDVDKKTGGADAAYYSASFSPKAGFYVLSYKGPGVPWQKVVNVEKPDQSYVLTNNEKLVNATMEFEAATIVHSTFVSDGYELNVKEIRPPRMDDTGRTKYPVLFRVYGGPSSQLVDVRFSRDWHDYLACGLGYVVVIVDGRGTGFKGRKLRNVVKGNLGYWEGVDQVAAARAWASREYVDPKRIGIWGWSYGGFMSSKVVEMNAGIHSLAMAVAPVTSWRLYDSIYTERYMNTPELNEGGYVNASISDVTGFSKVEFLLAHGSGDDNVHYANSAHLLDMFTKGQVRNFRFRMFTDSDHSITTRGGQREVYEYMTGFLVEKWGKGGRRRGW